MNKKRLFLIGLVFFVLCVFASVVAAAPEVVAEYTLSEGQTESLLGSDIFSVVDATWEGAYTVTINTYVYNGHTVTQEVMVGDCVSSWDHRFCFEYDSVEPLVHATVYELPIPWWDPRSW